nr:MAG TPA: hypothetical protein [Caudoviricetes sp.]
MFLYRVLTFTVIAVLFLCLKDEIKLSTKKEG